MEGEEGKVREDEGRRVRMGAREGVGGRERGKVRDGGRGGKGEGG